jgi:predicted dehydrogenase
MPQMKKSGQQLRWAILGAGKIAHTFAAEFKFLRNATLVAVASSDKQRAVNFARQYHIPEALSYADLYKSKNIDVVYIATTHNFHFEQCEQCLLNGKAVLCEKPITINDAQFKKLAALAARQKLFLMEAMWTCLLPAIQQAKRWLDAGAIGTPRLLKCDFGWVMDTTPTGRMYNPQLAGGALLDLGVYPVAMASFFFNGQSCKTIATGTLSKTGVDVCTSLLLKYPSATAQLYTSMEMRTANELFIYGDKGYIKIPEFWRASSCLLYNHQHRLTQNYTVQRMSHGFIYQMQHANDSVLAAETQSDVLTHSLSNQIHEILTAARAQTGVCYPGES